MARCAAALAIVAVVGACEVPIVPTERMPIDWVRTGTHGHYEKAGVDLAGLTCGEQYHRAVAGVPEAEDLMDRCERETKAYGYLMGGFIVLPGAGIAAAELFDHGSKDVMVAGIVAGVASFALGVAFGVLGRYKLSGAVHAYNRGIR